MKRLQKISAVLLAWLLVIGMSLPVYADNWTSDQKDNNHNGVITDSAPITDSPTIEKTLKLTSNGSGWNGVDTTPVMQTLTGGDTYAYIIYDGYTVSGNNGGGRLAKIKANGATEVWNKQLTLSTGFQLSTPLLVQGNDAASEADDAIYVGTTGYSQMLKNDELNGTAPSNWTVTGGTTANGHIAITGNAATSLTQSGLSLSTTATNRVATGIWVGNSATPGIAIDVTVKVGGVTKVTKSFPSSTTAIQDAANPGNYYYYVNENFAATSGSDVEFIVDVKSGNSGTVKVEYASLYQQTGSIQKVTNLHLSTPSNTSIVTDISGQINTPITTDGTYLYFGTWTSGSNPSKYYQVKISDNSVKTFTTDAYGFYWAGAVKLGNFIYFGSDNGKLYYRSVSNFDGNGGVINLPTYDGVAAGNVRSSIAVYDGNLYFTSQGKYLWSYKPNTRGVPQYQWHAKLAGTSTSTPVITSNGRIYVGYYGGFNAGGVQVIDVSTREVKDIVTVGPVQSSVIAYTSGSKDYLYFTTNTGSGAGYGYSYDGTTLKATKVWSTEDRDGKTYTLRGMAASNGYLVFGNDYNNVYIIH